MTLGVMSLRKKRDETDRVKRMCVCVCCHTLMYNWHKKKCKKSRMFHVLLARFLYSFSPDPGQKNVALPLDTTAISQQSVILNTAQTF